MVLESHEHQQACPTGMQVKRSQEKEGDTMPMDLEDREVLSEICDALGNTHTAMMNILETLRDLQKGQMLLMAMAQEHRPADIRPLPLAR